ncbi:MAG TPA: DUF4011 domain-containing protein [Fimbriimonadaceae bacterium]|nr:DUF4011 domain-containing protein [Fimbriimonadaceae bacterium]
MHDPQVVSERLQASRRNLLDTSRRNRLINYRTPRAVGVDVIGEDPFEVLRLLVHQAKAMTFRGKPDPLTKSTLTKPPGHDSLFIDSKEDAVSAYELRVAAEEELAGFLGYEHLPVDQADLYLDTHEYESKLKARLLKTFRDARTIIEESGVNVLFLALGMLEWTDRDTDKSVRRSPLVLVPVQLEPRPNGTYRLRHDGGEVGGNLSLKAMLFAEFGIRLPTLSEEESFDVRAYFAAVKRSIEVVQPAWHVDDRAIALSFFSYAKYFLYMDLDETKWPEEDQPSQHALLGSLLDSGFADEHPGLPDEGPLDPWRPQCDIHDVIGADSSQTLAVMEAAVGRSMVLQGPPGTGKSQTITNLMADALARGKRVLFVAEKMAALEVVARRMEGAGLRDTCLELHSHKTRKADFYKGLRHVQELAPSAVPRLSVELEMLEAHRDELNAYSTAVNSEFGSRGLSPRNAMGHLIQIGPEAPGLVRIPSQFFESWNEDKFRASRVTVRVLQTKIAADGRPTENPFYGTRMVLLIGMDVAPLWQGITDVQLKLHSVRECSGDLAAALHIEAPRSIEEVALVANAAMRAAEAPPLDGVVVSTATWVDNEAQLRTAIAAGASLFDVQSRWAGKLRFEAWESDVDLAQRALRKFASKWYRVLIGDYRRAAKCIGALMINPRESAEAKLDLCDAVKDVQHHRKVLDESQELCQSLFGAQWQGESSDWASLSKLTDWLVRLHRDIGQGDIPPGLLRFFDGKISVPRLTERAEAILAQARDTVTAVKEVSASLEFPSVPAPLVASFEEGLQLVNRWIEGRDDLERLVNYNKLARAAEEQGVGAVVELCERWEAAPSRLEESFARSWYETVLRQAFAELEPLRKFDRVRHEDVIKAFRALDEELLRSNRARIRLQHYQGVPRTLIGGSASWLQRQMGLKRSHAPIRKAMSEAAGVIQAIKPIFMMSPLSVAMMLPQDGPRFDLVIFDEASQVKPEDAFGSILRGSQMIVVGDRRQMPPTSFFDKITSEDQEEDDQLRELNLTKDTESILSLMDSRVASGSPRRRPAMALPEPASLAHRAFKRSFLRS